MKRNTQRTQKLSRNLESWFNCREIEGLQSKLDKLPAGKLKLYVSSAWIPEELDPANSVEVKWIPVKGQTEGREDFWHEFYRIGRHVIEKQTGIKGESSPLWVRGIDFIPNRKGAKA